MPADGISLPPKKGTSARPAGAARMLGYINRATGRKGHDRLWHKCEVTECPLNDRYRVQSGRRSPLRPYSLNILKLSETF
jgi:hypothetical protein